MPLRPAHPPVCRAASLASVLGLVLWILAGCANPVPPSGGPRDQRPPRIVTSRPEAEATGVSGQVVRIAFNEYVDRGSLREALTVTPRPSAPLEFDWSRRSVEITFPEPFRDSTTYLLTIDKTLRDLREGVQPEQPITLAFSTGDRIDRGRLSGRVVGGARGEAREGIDVYAYAAAVADSAQLPADGPLYRTQTGPDGAFAFGYLREGSGYYVVALQDANRDRRPDPLEAFAAPPQPRLSARTGGSSATTLPAALADSTAGSPGDDAQAPWVVGAEDPVPPRLTGALPLSRSRVALRFNEPIRLQNRRPGRFALTDTATGRAVTVRSVYRRPGQPQRLTLRTAPMQPSGHRIRLREGPPPVATDTSGNAPEQPASAAFAAPERPDTLGLRFLGFTKEGPPLPVSGSGGALVLAPEQQPAVQFNQPPATDSLAADSAALAAARQLISARDTTTGTALTLRLATDDGTTYRVAFDPQLEAGQIARLRVDGGRLRPPLDTVYTRLARRIPPDALGAVGGGVRVVQDGSAPADSATAGPVTTDSIAADSIAADSALIDSVADDSAAVSPATADSATVDSAASASPPVIVELYTGDGTVPLRTMRADGDGAFVFRRLPEGAYRFRAFLDQNGDGRWNPGRLAPYRPAEPLAWSTEPVRARPRWETAAGETLRIDAAPPSAEPSAN